ncbi:MAG: GTPase [Isosphaeraceae bacterium]|nr:GTPase [Isosphaeraceae bacterium]
MVSRSPTTTHAAVLTAEGRGAIALVRVWGPGAVAAVDAGFRPARGASLAETAPGRPRFGRFGAGLGDEVVVVIHAEPLGLEAEVQCHGGLAAVELVLDDLRSRGVRVVRPERWALRRGGSRNEAEALWLLAFAPTPRTASILVDQAAGALDRALAEIETADPAARRGLAERILVHRHVGMRLISGFRVAIAGRPNVGKSRLLNALVGFDRAIVDPTPGTTRDLVGARTAVAGWPIEIVDTAGLRSADDPLEVEGIARARRAHAEADLVILVLDRSTAPTPEDLALIDRCPHALMVGNKVDLPGTWEPPGELSVSAEHGDGIERLIDAIARRLVPKPPEPGAAVPFRRRHLRLLERVQLPSGFERRTS